MSDQDTVQVTERLEAVRLKNAIFEHAAKHSTSIDAAAADIIVRGAMVAISRQTPPVLILKGTTKILQAYKESGSGEDHRRTQGRRRSSNWIPEVS